MCINIGDVNQLVGHCLIPLDSWEIQRFLNKSAKKTKYDLKWLKVENSLSNRGSAQNFSHLATTGSEILGVDFLRPPFKVRKEARLLRVKEKMLDLL